MDSINSHELFSLEGKLAIVTGCNCGIGFAMATALASAGANIIGISRSLDSKKDEIALVVQNMGRKFSCYKCDFDNLEAVESTAVCLLEEHGVPDILINNAGTIQRAPIEKHTTEMWNQVMNINLHSQWLFSKIIGSEMAEKGSGKIVFTASLLSFQGGINVPSYAASKGAITQLTKALANEWSARGVNVNAIAPGYVATNNTLALRENPTRNAEILARIPMGRWAKPNDFAGPVVFLSSRASDYVSGEVLVVDGGWMGR